MHHPISTVSCHCNPYYCHCPLYSRRMTSPKQRYFSSDNGRKSQQQQQLQQQQPNAILAPSDLELARQAVATDSEKEYTGLTNIPGVQLGGRKLALVFTCSVCNTRAAKQFTEQAYRHGVVMVRCPGCEKYHLIADHLGFFQNESWDIEQAMAELGSNIKAVTNDNVLELTMDDLMGHDKMKEWRDNYNADELSPPAVPVVGDK